MRLLLAVAVLAGALTACGPSSADVDLPTASTAASDSASTGDSALTCELPPSGDSSPTDATLDLENVGLQGVAVAADGTVFAADATASRILRISKYGKITHFAGQPGWHGFAGDGCPARNARLRAPLGLAVDFFGNLYITDHKNARIRKVDREGIITTVVGSGDIGFAGDGGPATRASLQAPVDVDVDHAGRIYIADRDNNRVRKVDTDGTITTFAGDGSNGPDRIEGPATEASLDEPVAVAAGPGGVVYISDEWAHRIYRVGADGVMTTFAGTGKPGYSGDGGPATNAELHDPYGLTTDARGNVYIADYENDAIRVVDRKGIIRTVAVSSAAGKGGSGKPATEAALSGPWCVAVDQSGALYVTDDLGVRRVDPEGKISTILP